MTSEMQALYGNYPDANKVFRWVNCLQQVSHSEEGWDTAYCTELITVSILSFINAALLAYLLVMDIRRQRLNQQPFLVT